MTTISSGVEKKKVLCTGIIVADFLVKPVKESPQKGKLTLVEKAEIHLGGCAVNTGVVLKKLGVNVAIMGKVGNDDLGKFIVGKLKEEGVEIDAIKISPEVNTSGTAVLVHSDGERSFIHSIGANAHFSLSDIDFDYVKKFHILHIAGALLMPGFDGAPMAEAFKKAKEAGLITCLDTAWDSTGRWLEILKDSFPFVDFFLPSIEEAKMITGKEKPEEIAKVLLDFGVKNVCLKMGENGSFIMNTEEKHYFPALKINVVDATGAGDGYVAGFIVGLVNNFSFEKCGLLANLTGAKIAISFGATSGVKSWDDLVKFGENYDYKI